MKIDICTTILSLNPTAQVTVTGDDVNQIEWLKETQPIAKNIILAKQKELQTEYENKLTQEQSDKKSALNKLSALGLTEAEIKAILNLN